MRYLNIEVALGLVAIAVVANRSIGVELPWTWYLVVPLVTWAVYTLDRIIDSRRPELTPNTGRHAFHAQYRRPLLMSVMVAVIIAGVTAVIDFPVEYWLVAIGLGILTVLHLALQRTDSRGAAVIKDVNVVVTYALSAWAIPLVEAARAGLLSETASVWVPALGITLALVLIDVLLLSLIDRDEDAGAGRPSISVALGTPGTYIAVGVLSLFVVTAVVLWLFPAGLSRMGVLFLTMTAAYGMLGRFNVRDPDLARLALEWDPRGAAARVVSHLAKCLRAHFNARSWRLRMQAPLTPNVRAASSSVCPSR